MRGYYYDRGGESPQLWAPPAPRRRGPRPVFLFLCTLVLLVGLAVGVGLWWREAPEVAEDRPSQTQPVLPPREEEETQTTVERAPLGDGTVLTLLPRPEEEPHSFQQVYRENIDSIVSIRGEASGSTSFGTGVVLSDDGYIITNAHVIQGCSAVEVVLQDERVFDALLVGMDQQTDLAVLKIAAQQLTPARFGDSAQLEVGDTVLAIGNPLGEELRGTMTDGIISAINRDVNVDGYTMVLLQTTAALNSGNSGGALINEWGQVVGITNLKMQSYDNTVEGLGFAIPTATVKAVVDTLIAQGVVTGRPTIGITGYTVTGEMADTLGLPRGVYVSTVTQGSGADAAGIFPGDVIVEADGRTIVEMEQLQTLKDSLRVGDTLTLRIWRSGAYLERRVVLMEQYQLAD